MKRMKNSLLSTLIVLLVVFSASSQSKYEKVMQKSLATLDTAESLDTYNGMANRFERIALAEKDKWLPYYWSAYCYTMSSFDQKIENAEKDKYLDKALSYLDSAANLEALLDEVYVLKGLALTAKIIVDPMARGAKYGPLAGKERAKAKEVNPDNPRYYYMEGMNLIQTPAMWGGDKQKGKEMLEIAVEKYDTFEPLSELHPDWGEEQAKGTLKSLDKAEEDDKKPKDPANVESDTTSTESGQ